MKKILIILFIMTLFVVGCSSDEKTKEQSANEQTEEVAITENEHEETVKEVKYYEINIPPGRELTELEQEFLRYPGIYSGDNYNEEKVKETLDQLPDDLTAEEYLEELKLLLLEDYHEELEIFLNFDSTVDVEITRPDESVDVPTLKTAHYAILIDASGSMKEYNGNKTRMDAAKEAVLEFAEQIPENATISLRVYGHKGSGTPEDRDLSCSSTESYYNGAFEKASFQDALKKVNGSGYTPIALALETVKEDIPENVDEAIVYVVSDGIETCGGDPVKAVKELVAADIETVVNIIGFDVDNEGQKVLKEVATAGNGEFTYVGSEQDIKKYMREQYEEILKAWYDWREKGESQTFDIREEKEKLVFDTRESMENKIFLERRRMENAQFYLRDKFGYSHQETQDLLSMIIDYSNKKLSYTIDYSNKLWSDVIKYSNEEWSNIIDESNENISETINKTYDNY